MNCESGKKLKEEEEGVNKVEENDNESDLIFLSENKERPSVQIDDVNLNALNTKGKTIDNILDKIGYTMSHKILIACCGIFFIAEGAQLYSLNMLIPVFLSLFPDNEKWVVFLASSLFIGYMFGTFFTGILTKNYGRRKSIVSLIFIYLFLAITICLFENVYILSLYRFSLGLCLGVIGPQYLSNLSEFLPSDYKELVILSMSIFYRIGVIYFILCFRFLSPNVYLNNWRYSLLLSAIPVLISAVLTVIYLKDSPKLLLVKKKVEDAVGLLNDLAGEDTDSHLTEHQVQSLREEYTERTDKTDNKISYKMLISQKFRALIVLCAMIYLISSMVGVTNSYSIPIMLSYRYNNESGKVLANHLAYDVLITQVVSIPAVLIAALSCHMVGRKQTILIGFASCILASAFPSIFKEGLIISSAFINFFIVFALCSIKVYIIEAFPTYVRDYALSFCFFCGKLGDAMTPLLCNLSLGFYSYGPMVLTNSISFLGLISTLLLPYDTQGLHTE